MPELQHSTLGASSAYRWMNCPGSVQLSKGLPDRTGAAAHTGSAAHRLGEVCLLSGDDPWEYLGEPVPDYPDVVADQTMVDAVTVYVDHIRSYGVKITEDMIERKMSLAALAGGDEDHIAHSMFGTADFVWYDKKAGRLYVDDYKNGSGVVVSAKGNLQGRYYAVGAMLELGLWNEEAMDCAVIHIIQPNARKDEAVENDVVFASELRDWAENELIPAAELTTDEDAPLKAGDWCKFCKAKPICPKIAEKAMADAELEFDGDEAKTLTAKDQLEPAQIRRILDNRKFIEDWLKSVFEYAEEQALHGEDVTEGGWALKKGRKSRAWKDEQAAAEAALSWGVPKESVYTEPAVRSPAQLEKAVGKDKKSELAVFISETEGPKKLAPVSSKRETVQAGAKADFED